MHHHTPPETVLTIQGFLDSSWVSLFFFFFLWTPGICLEAQLKTELGGSGAGSSDLPRP